MTTQQPEALRLADKMSSFTLRRGYAWYCHKAADELRRLHVVEKQRDDLLEALKELDAKPGFPSSWLKARAAIAKAERTTP